jgi:hypothetical protein
LPKPTLKILDIGGVSTVQLQVVDVVKGLIDISPVDRFAGSLNFAITHRPANFPPIVMTFDLCLSLRVEIAENHNLVVHKSQF